MLLFAAKRSVVARINGIGVADMRWRDDSREAFRMTIEASLQLIREHDPRRYQRIRQHLKRIINSVGEASYWHGIRACQLMFRDFRGVGDDLNAAYYAVIIIHEATHGFIECRGFAYNETNRAQIERICVTEANRFAAKLARLDSDRYPPRLLQSPFNPDDWNESWAAGPLEWRGALLKRFLTDAKAEQE